MNLLEQIIFELDSGSVVKCDLNGCDQDLFNFENRDTKTTTIHYSSSIPMVGSSAGDGYPLSPIAVP
jgi:hypothetical protein